MFENVLVGVDGRPNARDAVALAQRLVDRDGQLTLAHVHRGEMPSIELLQPQLAAADVNMELKSVVAAHAGAGLHRQADTQHADLLVVGSCSHGLLGRAMLADNTAAALNGAPCAVAVAARGYAEQGHAIKTLGVAYNASPESKAALDFARRLAASVGASIKALEVVSIPSVAFTGIVPAAIGDSVDAMLDSAAARLQALPDVDATAVYGLPGEELAAFSAQVDLLVVGSRGYGPVKRLVLGSTSNYLARHARSSLLVLPRLATSPADGAAARPGVEVGAEA
ncbi:MAG TPA: universal stress protein [Solirubrobacteraceae bacterium]|jgi:nucleotide-binding universal stress UspA family protein|nr:universal stress protein [Solirubrobacteraceae bacterium]